MKADICESAMKLLGVKDGKVTKPKPKELEAEEMQVYLTKLKELVPFMPKNRKLSKLEVIQYVIDYICDLQNALETHPVNKVSPSGNRQPLQPLGVVASTNTCAQEVGFPLLYVL